MRNTTNATITTGSMARFFKAAAMLGLALAPFCVMADDYSSNSFDVTTATNTGWILYGQPIVINTDQYGYPNSALGPGAIQTANQELSTGLNLYVFKSAAPIQGSNYYLVTGTFRHGVMVHPAGTSVNLSNWLSVGIYATEMKLVISGNGAQIADCGGPSSTVNSTTAGWSVSASGGADSSGPNGSASVGYSYSNTAPDVSFAATCSSDTFVVTASLPGVTASRNNPESPSYGGYQFVPGTLFKVPVASNGNPQQELKLTVTTGVQWQYNYTRGITYEHYYSWATGVFHADFKAKQFKQNTSGLCLGVAGSFQNQASVDLQPCNSSLDSQMWTYTQNGQIQVGNPNGVIVLPVGVTGWCLDGPNGNSSAGSSLVIAPCTAGKVSQQFQVATMEYLTTNFDSSRLVGLPPYGLGEIAAVTRCSTASPTSFGTSSVVCSDLVNDAPTVAAIQTTPGLPGNRVIGTLDATSSGAFAFFQNPLAWNVSNNVMVPDYPNVANHYFKLQ
jgi:hypothetical protein